MKSKINDRALNSEHPDLDDFELAVRLRQSLNTIRTWRARNPERLPPGVKIGRVWLYNKSVVELWLAEQMKLTPQGPIKKQIRTDHLSLSQRGKPTRAETLAAHEMGVTVPIWRAIQREGEQSKLNSSKKSFDTKPGDKL